MITQAFCFANKPMCACVYVRGSSDKYLASQFDDATIARDLVFQRVVLELVVLF